MSRKSTSRKPERQDARPFQHASGRWAKKCRGSFIYLGRVADDPTGEAAWQKWLDIRDDVRAGRKPRPKVDGTLTVEDLINLWLDSKRRRVDTGELSLRTWQGYKALGLLIVESIGRTRSASDVGPADFAALRVTFAKRWGPGKLATAVTHTRSIWKWGFQAGRLAAQARFGEDFSKPSAKVQRQARNEKGPRMFQPGEVLAILDVADGTMKAMILLGVQSGIGNTDLAMLPVDALDLDAGWLTLPRCKTAIVRRIPLWNETVEAIRAVLAHRPQPRHGNENYLFLAPNGTNLICNRYGTVVSKLFSKAALAAGVTGRTFYDCRRTFATVADGAKDPVATASLMGHSARAGDMQAIYRQMVSDERLRAVTDHVRRWLYGQDDDGTDGDRQDGQKGRQDAPESTKVQKAVIRCLKAIEAAQGPDKAVLASVWNSSEIALALSGDSWTVKRFLDTWGDDQGDRPTLRIVG